MRTLLTSLLLSLVVAAPAAAATRTVNVGDDYFARPGDPPTVKVKKGTTVEWEWVGKSQHNVVVTKGPKKFQSEFKRSGTFRRTLNRTGTYKIICSIHQPDMTMTLKVRKP